MQMLDVLKEADETPLAVVFDCPSKACNYRCPYCFHQPNGFVYRQEEFERWQKLLDLIVTKIKRPLFLVIGPSGEPLVFPEWWLTLHHVLTMPNVKTVSLVSNLSKPISPFLEGADMSKIGIKASLHPTQLGDERDLAFFMEQALWLKRTGAHLVVNYVLHPCQLMDFPKYYKMFTEEGLRFTANVFRGVFDEKVYPNSYTTDELGLMKGFLSSEPFIFDYQSYTKNPFGRRCAAGRYCIYVTLDGAVLNCLFDRQRLGSILDDELFLYSENCYCTSNVCECHWSIGLMEHVYRRFKKPHFPIIGYTPRDVSDIGEHPYE